MISKLVDKATISHHHKRMTRIVDSGLIISKPFSSSNQHFLLNDDQTNPTNAFFISSVFSFAKEWSSFQGGLTINKKMQHRYTVTPLNVVRMIYTVRGSVTSVTQPALTVLKLSRSSVKIHTDSLWRRLKLRLSLLV